MKKEYPDMEVRLQKGLSFYKQEEADKYCTIMN